MNKKTKGECKSVNTCKKCKYPCVNQGEDLKPITIDELRERGYVLCDEYIEKNTLKKRNKITLLI